MSRLEREVVHPESVPAPPFPYSHAIKAGPFVFPSGQLASDYETGIAPEARVPAHFPLHSSAVLNQTRYLLRTMDTILRAAGSSIESVARIDQYLIERHLERYIQGRNEWITRDRPASTAK